MWSRSLNKPTHELYYITDKLRPPSIFTLVCLVRPTWGSNFVCNLNSNYMKIDLKDHEAYELAQLLYNSICEDFEGEERIFPPTKIAVDVLFKITEKALILNNDK